MSMSNGNRSCGKHFQVWTFEYEAFSSHFLLSATQTWKYYSLNQASNNKAPRHCLCKYSSQSHNIGITVEVVNNCEQCRFSGPNQTCWVRDPEVGLTISVLTLQVLLMCVAAWEPQSRKIDKDVRLHCYRQWLSMAKASKIFSAKFSSILGSSYSLLLPPCPLPSPLAASPTFSNSHL